MTEYLICFDADKCVQCHGCETACKSWRGLPDGVQNRRVFNLWSGRYPEITSSSLSIACLHCVAPACMDACPKDAIKKQKTDGRVLVDAGLCIGCRLCAKACPFGVPQFGPDKTMQKCDLCFDQPLAGGVPPCVATCPGNALHLEKVAAREKTRLESRMISQLRQAAAVSETIQETDPPKHPLPEIS